MKRVFPFKLKQRVFWHDDPERSGLVVAIILCPFDELYRVQWSPTDATEHYAFELTDEKPPSSFS